MKIKEIAKGNWKPVLMALGVGEQYLRNRHGPCPICGGKDRFRWDDQNSQGGYICGSCGGGDGFMLAQKVTGATFKQVAEVIEQQAGRRGDFVQKGPDMEEVQQRNARRRVWEAAGQPLDGGPVGRYLCNRVGCLWPSNELREAIHKGHPLMVARILTAEGDKVANIHLTALGWDGRKRDISPAKKVMPGKLPDGCAIRLGPTKAVMGVAEGIETAISAAILFDMPVWACVNGNLLSKWIPPAMAEQVTVFGDNDASFTGQAKAYHLANRLEVQFRRRVQVMIPPTVGEDWNDHHHATWGQAGNHLRLVK
jgi:putative DNA primase/helicase